MGRSDAGDPESLAHLLHQRGYLHLRVQSRGKHLIVSSEEEGVLEPRLRLTLVPGRRYGVSFRHHTGRWEAAPIVGTMVDVIDIVEATAGWHLEPWPASGTNF